MDKCTVPAHSAHHADKAHRSRLKKMTTKKRFHDDCFMYDCADISVVEKRKTGKKK